MNDDLVKLLKYELGDSPSIEKKAERLARRFYEPGNFASKNRMIDHAVLSRLLEEPNQALNANENRLAEIFLELQISRSIGLSYEHRVQRLFAFRRLECCVERPLFPSIVSFSTLNILAEK
jgi:hypothetical protein